MTDTPAFHLQAGGSAPAAGQPAAAAPPAPPAAAPPSVSASVSLTLPATVFPTITATVAVVDDTGKTVTTYSGTLTPNPASA